MKKEYETVFKFEPATDVYLKVTMKVDGPVRKSEAFDVANRFWSASPERIRTNSNYVYLNFYDRQNNFVFQVFWDPNGKEYRISSTEYY